MGAELNHGLSGRTIQISTQCPGIAMNIGSTGRQLTIKLCKGHQHMIQLHYDKLRHALYYPAPNLGGVEIRQVPQPLCVTETMAHDRFVPKSTLERCCKAAVTLRCLAYKKPLLLTWVDRGELPA